MVMITLHTIPDFTFTKENEMKLTQQDKYAEGSQWSM